MTEYENASSLTIEYVASYADLICGYSASASHAEREIRLVLRTASDQIECVKDGMCIIRQLEVVNCTTHSREKRELSLEKAGFSTKYECDADTCKDNMILVYYMMFM